MFKSFTDAGETIAINVFAVVTSIGVNVTLGIFEDTNAFLEKTRTIWTVLPLILASIYTLIKIIKELVRFFKWCYNKYKNKL